MYKRQIKYFILFSLFPLYVNSWKILFVGRLRLLVSDFIMMLIGCFTSMFQCYWRVLLIIIHLLSLSFTLLPMPLASLLINTVPLYTPLPASLFRLPVCSSFYIYLYMYPMYGFYLLIRHLILSLSPCILISSYSSFSCIFLALCIPTPFFPLLTPEYYSSIVTIRFFMLQK